MKKLFISFVIFTFVANISFASMMGGYDAGTLNSQTMRDLRTHEAMTRAKNKSAIITTKRTPLQEREIQQERDRIINSNIQSISFVNNSSIPTEELSILVADKIGKPMSAQNISDIRKTVMRYYQKQGFYSAVAIVSAQDSKTGEIVMEIREGGKNSISIQQ